jgi:hypothetical protein
LSSQAYDQPDQPDASGSSVANQVRSPAATELGSSRHSLAQPWAVGSRAFRFPPWCATTVISPETRRPAPVGEPGLLRVVDLANVASVLAIQTEDLAVQESDGAGFRLLGRAPSAVPRGCSLLPQDTLQKPDA